MLRKRLPRGYQESWFLQGPRTFSISPRFLRVGSRCFPFHQTSHRGYRYGCCEDAIQSSHPSVKTKIPAAVGPLVAQLTLAAAVAPAPPALISCCPAHDGNTFGPDYVQDPMTKFWMNRRTGNILTFFPGAGHSRGFSQTSHPHYSVAQPVVRND